MLLGLALVQLGDQHLFAQLDKHKSVAPPGAEGRLHNDSFLPTDQDAQARLKDGDDALKAARSAGGANLVDAQRHYIECFDTWHSALTAAAPEASVWVALVKSPERSLSEGLRYAIARRLAELSAKEQALWSERVEGLAGPALQLAGSDPRSLKLLVQRFPLTRSASRAALTLADIALERGALSEAGTWLQRALADLPKAAASASLAQAIERRCQGLVQPKEVSVWDAATGFEVVSAIPIGLNQRQRSTGLTPRSARMRGPRPGLISLSKTRLAVQIPGQILLFRLSERGVLSKEFSFLPPELHFASGASLPFSLPEFNPQRARRAPGWQFAPSASGSDLFVVSGHSVPEGLPNALLSIALPEQLLPGSRTLPGRGQEPVINWAILGNEWVDREGHSHGIERLRGLVDLEFQAGPVVVDNRVLVQARSYGDVVRAWLMCFDRHSGQLQWRHLLGTGADLLEDQGRLGVGAGHRLGAPPMTRVSASNSPGGLGERLFVPTNLGFAVLVDLLDGRPLWSFKNRRRQVEDLGWDGYAAPLGQLGERPILWWAAFDSDRLYALAPEPLSGTSLDRFSVLAQRPLPVGESRTLIGADGHGVLVQGRAGRERTVSSLSTDPQLGSVRVDALYLGPGEEFLGRGLMSSKRVMACTERGLYLFDRERELYLLGYTALPRMVGTHHLAPGGDLYALDGLVLALGKNGIWSFRPN